MTQNEQKPNNGIWSGPKLSKMEHESVGSHITLQEVLLTQEWCKHCVKKQFAFQESKQTKSKIIRFYQHGHGTVLFILLITKIYRIQEQQTVK